MRLSVHSQTNSKQEKEQGTKQTKQNKPQNKSEVHVQEVAIGKVPKLAVDHVVDLVIKSRLIALAKCMTESKPSQ